MPGILARKTKSKKEEIVNMARMHKHPHYEIYYLARGDRNYYINNEKYRITSGDMALIPPEVKHRAAGKISECFHVYFDGHLLPPKVAEAAQTCFRSFVLRVPPIRRSEIEKILSDMCREYEKRGGFLSEQLLTSLLCTLIINLCRISESNAVLGGSPDLVSKSMTDIADYIDRHYADDITSKNLSEHFFLSHAHFCRRFKEAIGFSPAEYINGVRVNEAAKLLNAGSMSVTEIAARTGFSNSNYFGGVFKKYMGVSPREYRTLTRNGKKAL